MTGAIEISPEMKTYLGVEEGWFGVVTHREFIKDRAYTTKVEQRDLLETFLGNEVLDRKGHGGRIHLDKAGISPHTEFVIATSNQSVHLRLLYPKKKGNELRIYFESGNFSPNEGDHIYIYIKNDRLHLGAFNPDTVDLIKTLVGQKFEFGEKEKIIEPEVDDYQTAINSPPTKAEKNSFAWLRNAKVARQAVALSDYTCEMMPEIDLFVSNVSKKPFLEAHHLVPMNQQSSFKQSLDIVHNICALNPLAHRLLHHGTIETIEPYLDKLFQNRVAFFDSINVTQNDLKELYK